MAGRVAALAALLPMLTLGVPTLACADPSHLWVVGALINNRWSVAGWMTRT